MLIAVNRNKLLQKPHLACRIICISTLKLSNRVTSAILKAHIILNDPYHPLHLYFIVIVLECVKNPLSVKMNFLPEDK